VAQEAHTVVGVSNQGHLADLSQLTTHAIATLCLHKPWQQQWRTSLEPLYLEGATIPPPVLATNIRTLSISEIHSTLPLDEHQEALEGLAALEDLEIPMEDLTPQGGYPPLILFPSNLEQT